MHASRYRRGVHPILGRMTTTHSLDADRESVALLEARALEKMARALREHSRQLLEAAEVRDGLGSREAKLQVRAFAERCAQADALLEGDDERPSESRLARLEKLVNALECSRAYFRGVSPGAAARGTETKRGRNMVRWIAVGLGLSATLSGCGLAATSGAAATNGAAAAAQAEAAHQTLDKVRSDLDAAEKTAADARARAEAAAE